MYYCTSATIKQVEDYRQWRYAEIVARCDGVGRQAAPTRAAARCCLQNNRSCSCCPSPPPPLASAARRHWMTLTRAVGPPHLPQQSVRCWPLCHCPLTWKPHRRSGCRHREWQEGRVRPAVPWGEPWAAATYGHFRLFRIINAFVGTCRTLYYRFTGKLLQQQQQTSCVDLETTQQ